MVPRNPAGAATDAAMPTVEGLRVAAALGADPSADRAQAVREIILRWRNECVYNTVISQAGAQVVNHLNSALDELAKRLIAGVR